MKKYIRILSSFLAIVTLAAVLAACDPAAPETGSSASLTETLKFDMSTDTLKQEVTVKAYIDGDTTHFYVPESVISGGVLKARYLAVNTPESTGKIEEWGKAASKFTKGKLSEATSIFVESDDSKWNVDSTGGRYLVWVWYKTADSEDYRNLNVELLENGLAIASNSANNRYGETCMAAINKAKEEKLHVHSSEKDPNFPYGEAVELTLRELRTNIEAYDGQKVAFEGVISKNHANTAYIEDYDAETDMYYAISAFYGYGLNGKGLEILSVGNRVRIVGTVQYYETGGYYQVAGLEYSPMRPNSPNNIKKISDGHDGSYIEIDPEKFVSGKVSVERGDETVEMSYAELLLDTSVRLGGLTVKSIYTTTDEESSQLGAMTITCETEDKKEITVRTAVLYDGAGNKITAAEYENRDIEISGIVTMYNGGYQIKVFSYNDILVR